MSDVETYAAVIKRSADGRETLMRGMDGLTLGERLRRLRHAAGRKQNEVAFSAEVNVFQLCRWENDQCEPNLYHFAAIADCLGVSMDFLFWGYEKAARP